MPWQNLLTYWRGKHRAGQLPARADLDPLIEIPGLVPNIFLIDRVGDAFRLRLVGSELALRARTDLTGTIVNSTNIDAPGVEAFVAFLGRAARDRAPVLYASAPGYQSSNGAIRESSCRWPMTACCWAAYSSTCLNCRNARCRCSCRS